MNDAVSTASPQNTPDSESPRDRALRRLAGTRALLRQEMTAPPSTIDRLERGGVRLMGRWGGRLLGLWRFARQRARRQPALLVALGAVEEWWREHPWRAPSELALVEVQTRVAPLVRRHPVASVALCAGLGALLTWARPWRMPWVTRQVRMTPRRALDWVFHELRHLPLSALLTGLLANVAQSANESATNHAAPEAANEPSTNTTPPDAQHGSAA